jgi:ribosomal protein S3
MGQKVHPLGFRVGITKKHQSQWFARFNKHKYAQSVLEDRMLRQTLTSLFPQLLNPVLKKVQKRDEESSVVPRITQIKIERGLIPYEIGIQIHAENCDLIKSSIDNLKINRDLVCQLQKTRRYLQHLRLKLNDYTTLTDSLGNVESTTLQENAGQSSLSSGKDEQKKEKSKKTRKMLTTSQRRTSLAMKTKKSFKNRYRTRTRLTKQQYRRQRLLLKRLRKRQSIRRRYNQMAYKGLFLSKKGNKIIQKLTRLVASNSSKRGNKSFNKKRFNGNVLSRASRDNVSKIAKIRTTIRSKSAVGKGAKKNTSLTLLNSRIKKKFVSIFINRMNNKFLPALKNALKQVSLKNEVFAQRANSSTLKGNSNYVPLGWNKKWSFNSNITQKRLASQSFAKLQKLITVLEQKSLKKLESLRKDFIAFGSISKAASFNYYQMLMFLKQLKEHVSFIKRKQKLQLTIQKWNNEGNTKLERFKIKSQNSRLPKTQFLGEINPSNGDTNTITLNLLSKKLNNIENECRKIKFIEYLKGLVKKHRSENIYLYLATIAEARKDLRKLQQFTKRHASFLFGLNLLNTNTNDENLNLTEKVKERVNNVLEKTTHKSDFEKTLQDIFLEQIEKQRNVYKDNAQLTPKIAIKFYTVNAKSLKAKASVVADSVVDALEKRKAFRKVIKDAKEELMRTSGVKGVKIQVSGRLNGAEIARSEWVRAGRVPLQTLRANLDYSYKTANTIYGIIGVKVWIFKGYTKLI